MKTTRFAAVAGMLATAAVVGGAPAAFASYVPSANTTLNVNLPLPVPALPTGPLTFGLQQGVESLLAGTGVNLPYDYLIVSVNHQPAAYVDPFALYRD